MNILVAVDNNYYFPLLVMLTSLFENNKGRRISIFMLYDQLEDSYLKELKIFVNDNNSSLSLLTIDKNALSQAPIKENSHFTIATYYRLLAIEVLPRDLDRILYLDVDLIINKDLSKLYHMDFEGKFFVATEDVNMNKISIYEALRKRSELKMPKDAVYFNAGIMLFNLERLRAEYDINKVIEYIKKGRTKIKFCDQDVLNALFWNQVKITDAARYNYPAKFYDTKDKVNYFLYRNKLLKHVYIIHYHGSSKPWKLGYTGKLGGLFWKYAIKTPLRKRAYIAAVNFFYQIVFHLHDYIKSLLLYGIASNKK